MRGSVELFNTENSIIAAGTKRRDSAHVALKSTSSYTETTKQGEAARNSPDAEEGAGEQHRLTVPDENARHLPKQTSFEMNLQSNVMQEDELFHDIVSQMETEITTSPVVNPESPKYAQ